VAPHA
jgi:hypothetical protein